MRPPEFLELLDYVRTALQESGLGAVDQQAVASLSAADRSPRQLLDDYLRLLEAEIALGSRTTVDFAVGRLAELTAPPVRYDDFGQVLKESLGGASRLEGIALELGPEEAPLFEDGERAVDLRQLPDLSATLRQIRALRVELSESEDPA